MKVLRRDVSHIRWNPSDKRWEFFSTILCSWAPLIEQIPYEPCDYDVIVSYEDSWCEPYGDSWREPEEEY